MDITKNMKDGQKSTKTTPAAGPTVVRHLQSTGDKNSSKAETQPSPKLTFQARRKMVMEMIVSLYRDMLAVHDTRRRWIGTMTDLMELTHEAWQSDLFVDSHGRRLSFKAMAAHVCHVLHRHKVVNPYSYVEKSRRRKVSTEPILDRYTHLAIDYRLKNPMYMEMEFI